MIYVRAHICTIKKWLSKFSGGGNQFALVSPNQLCYFSSFKLFRLMILSASRSINSLSRGFVEREN